MPTIYGEKVVLRLLDKTPPLSQSGRHRGGRYELRKYEDLMAEHLQRDLIVGPTGTGKTTTMYTMIHELTARRPT